MKTKQKAPDFGADGYPSGGDLIGPAWQSAWEALHYNPEMTGDELALVMQNSASIKHKTAKNLLGQARKAGIITARRRKVGGKRSPVYRLAARDSSLA